MYIIPENLNKYFECVCELADSVSDPDPVGSAFKLGLDPGSGSVFGIRIRIQVSKK